MRGDRIHQARGLHEKGAAPEGQAREEQAPTHRRVWLQSSIPNVARRIDRGSMRVQGTMRIRGTDRRDRLSASNDGKTSGFPRRWLCRAGWRQREEPTRGRRRVLSPGHATNEHPVNERGAAPVGGNGRRHSNAGVGGITARCLSNLHSTTPSLLQQVPRARDKLFEKGTLSGYAGGATQSSATRERFRIRSRFRAGIDARASARDTDVQHFD